ncbi:MAG: system potassium uptake protein [Solirubrobacteraceae bacterium]|nr:system potassium uptake protein [Solirubrobacteraceae bacterium]
MRRAGRPRTRASPAGGALALGALGVVFGDIGTSPLYVMQTVFTAGGHAVRPTQDEVYGVVSLIFCTITLVVSIKYVSFVMRADNGGEGGIMALTALVQSARLKTPRAKLVLIPLGILGASLFYGDGVITPAISVLSATEGLHVAAPSIESLVLPLAIAVLIALFALQRYGTELVGRLFGPVMAVWFTVLALSGIAEIARRPAILASLSPVYGVRFFIDHGWVAFVALGSVVLAVTGAEALYADMGHFGRSPIRRAWFVLVFPALTLNYLGQGSLIARSPSAIENPFYLLVPAWAQLPMVALATLATVIASQAVISGAFSLTRQAAQLGFLPRMTIRHTSGHREGQVYLPAVNWALFTAVIALVVGFGSSSALGSAYGVAVTGTFLLNTVMFLAVSRLLGHTRKRLIALGAAVFLTVELAFFSSTLLKVVHGGWLPLVIGLAVFTVMMTWRRGQQLALARGEAKAGRLREFVRQAPALDPPVQRVPGTAVFLNAHADATPLALRANVDHNHVLHHCVLTMSIETASVPHVAARDRLTADDLGDAQEGFVHLTARFGYQDHPNVPACVRLAVRHGFLAADVDPRTTSYFVSRTTLVRTGAPGMSAWRKWLYVTIAHNAASAVEHFRLPHDRTVTMGEQVEF